MKTCSRCGKTQPVDEFSRHRSNRDGLRPQCKSCGRAYARAYHDANREKEHAYYEANRDRIGGVHRTYRADHPEAGQNYGRAYRADHPEVAWASNYRVRAKQAGHEPIVQEFTLADVVARYGAQCAYCSGGPFEHLDHAVPISKGGPHTIENVRPACAACNIAKHNRTPDEWQPAENASASTNTNTNRN